MQKPSPCEYVSENRSMTMKLPFPKD